MVWVDHSWEVSISASKHHRSENIGSRIGILPYTPMIRNCCAKSSKSYSRPLINTTIRWMSWKCSICIACRISTKS